MPNNDNETTARINCCDCNVPLNPEHVYSDVQGQHFCVHCYTANYTLCADCGAESPARSCNYIEVHSEGGWSRGRVCRACFEDRNVTCHSCNATFNNSDRIMHHDGHQYCMTCYSDNIAECERCENMVESDTMQDGYCPGCYSRGEWNDRGFYLPSPTYTKLRSKRKFGIEIETSACDNHNSVRNDTVFGCKPDGSIDGMEFVSPVLYGDEGLAEVDKICGHARQLGWEVDSSCGLHLHLDLSEETKDNCLKVAAAYMHTYDFWTTFISNARKRNYYCAKHKYSAADIEAYTDSGYFNDFCSRVSNGNRYDWVNWYAYTRHNTVEIRHHSATLNATKITNWVKAHARFIDRVVEQSPADINRYLAGRTVYDQWQVIAKWWDDEDLEGFYRQRAETFSKPIRREVVV